MYFGYACGNRSEHPQAVAWFTNIYMVTPESLNESLEPFLARLATLGMKALVALQPVVCDPVTGLRHPSWLTRLNAWKAAQGTALDSRVEAFYLPDEPYHLGWTRAQLLAVSARVKVLWPTHKQMMIEAATKVRLLGTYQYPIPAAVTYVGFDRYWTIDPNTDIEWNKDYNALKARLAGRRMVVVGESQWNGAYQAAFGNIGLGIDLMGPMFESYCKVAARPEVAVFMLYALPNGFESPDYIGAEGLPQEVIDLHISYGFDVVRLP